MSDVGKNIRKFRVQLNMTQEELAEKILSTRTTVSNYETGRSNPDIDMLVTICEVFDTSPDVLIYGSRTPEKQQGRGRLFVIGLAFVMFVWVCVLSLTWGSLFSVQGFPMYLSNVYEALLKPAFVFLATFLAALAAGTYYPSGKKWKYADWIIYGIAAAAVIWTVMALCAFAGFTKYFGGAAPAAVNGVEWTGWTNSIFTVFSKNYGNISYLLLYLILGALQGYCLSQKMR